MAHLVWPTVYDKKKGKTEYIFYQQDLCCFKLVEKSILLRATAGTAVARLSRRNSVCLSVRPSVCLSHGWIRQKRCKL